jgi:hypothetical protein
MPTLTTTLAMPDWIAQGLNAQIYERVGGVVRNAQTKQVVAWLRETGGVERLAAQSLGILPTLGAAASMLNLAMTTIGFAVVVKQLSTLEKQLRQAQQALQHISFMLDLDIYASLYAALELAANTLTFDHEKHREAMAIQVIPALTKARFSFTALADAHLAQHSQFVDEYLAALALVYVAEARCYLELEALDTAQRILEHGIVEVEARARQHIQTLLTPNPAAYLHPDLRETIDLRRLTRVLRWLDPALDENAVFEAQRANLFAIARKPEDWIQSVPRAIWDPKVDQPDQGVSVPVVGRISLKDWGIGWLGSGESLESRILQRLPAAMLTMEALIEDVQRLQSYHIETQTIPQLGMSFRDWKNLLPPPAELFDSSDILYIVFDAPVKVGSE